jgi:hypothetical protein
MLKALKSKNTINNKNEGNGIRIELKKITDRKNVIIKRKNVKIKRKNAYG